MKTLPDIEDVRAVVPESPGDEGQADTSLPADLRNASLQGRDLKARDLSGVDLSGADLTGADLSGARLFKANLNRASLRAANLDGAECTGADLSDACLEDASARGTGFGMARLKGARMFSSNLEGATLSKADLTGADLRMARLRGARLRESILVDTDAAGADFAQADLALCDVKGASFNNAVLNEARLRAIKNFARAAWYGVDTHNINFAGAYRIRRHIIDENFLKEFRESGPAARILYELWRASSDCGRSIGRWMIGIAVVSYVFACLYMFVDVDYGPYQTWVSPWYFSVVTLTTLGFGDVVPISAAAKLLAVLEVIVGYLLLGGLISIFANKLARRGD